MLTSPCDDSDGDRIYSAIEALSINEPLSIEALSILSIHIGSAFFSGNPWESRSRAFSSQTLFISTFYMRFYMD